MRDNLLQKGVLGAITIVAAAGLGRAHAQAPSTTAFTYQGQIKQSGSPAAGPVDIKFRLFDAASGGAQVGPELTQTGVTLSNGLFSLPLDFGGVFQNNDSARWIELSVKNSASPTYNILSPRTAITAEPMSLVSKSLALPYTASVSTTGPALSLTNTASTGYTFLGSAAGSATAFRGVAADGYGFLGSASGAGGIGVGATHDATSGTAPALYAVTFSNTAGAAALFADVSSSNPGADTKAVWGLNHSSNGIGVYGQSLGAGIGVYGASAGGVGVRGYGEGSGTAVLGAHTNGNLGLLADPSSGVHGVGASASSFGGYFRNDSGVALKADGLAQVKVLQILGGSDLAEPFDVNPAETVKPQPGMLVTIDPAHPGNLKVASGAYDTRIAGAISGANGLSPGMVMKSEANELAHGEHPIAMTGRVWVWCDAAFGAISAGDRLTTSSTPGHAMRVSDDSRAPGSVVGKAMTELKEGRGLVMVLVNLQ